MTPTQPMLPAVRRTLRRIGQNVRAVRLARRLPMDIVAERAMTSRQTLARIERGDPAVGIGIYFSVLHALGLLDQAQAMAEPARDPEGAGEALGQLPSRAFLPGTRIPGSPTSRARTRRKTDEPR